MLKRVSIWFLIFAVLIANFSMALAYISFNLNQQYIAQNLCINRFKPGLHCNGHCYFMRKLKQAEDSEQKKSARGNSCRVEISFFQEPVNISIAEPSIDDEAPISVDHFTYIYSSHYLDAIFRPPKPLI